MDDLLIACNTLKSEKATERKKAAENLLNQLKRCAIVGQLDENTDVRLKDPSAKVFCWYGVFKRAFAYFSIECDSLEKATSKSALANRENRRKDIVHVIKEVVRTTEQNGHRLCVPEVLKAFLSVLQTPFQCEQFGNDFSTMLLKNILTSRVHWSQISATQWRTILKTFKKHMTLDPPVINVDTSSRVFHAAVQGATYQTDIREAALLPFFYQYFSKDVRSSRHSLVVLEYILSSLITLCQAVASNARHQVCKLGESDAVFVSLMYYWGSRGSESVKDKLVEFFCLQLSVHHPHGAHTEMEGAYAVDWELWKSHLRKLYDNIAQDMHLYCARSVYTTSARSSNKTVKTNFLDLAARVCLQVFSWQTSAVDVTQNTLLDASLSAPASKKRRVEAGWLAVCNKLTETGKEITPWLQLVERVLSAYPASLTENDAPEVLRTLHHVLAQSKKLPVTVEVIKCLHALCRCQQSCDWHEMVVETCSHVWKDVWTASLRCVTLRHAVAEGFALLSMLVQSGLIDPSKDVWSLFRPSTTSVSDHSVQFLMTMFKHSSIPENFQPDALTRVLQSSNRGSYPLRHEILEWLLPNHVDVLEDPPINLGCEIDPVTLGNALTFLIQTNTLEHSGSHGETAREAKDVECKLKAFESIYLKSSFNESPPSKVQEVTSVKPSFISALCDAVIAALVRDARMQFEIQENEDNLLDSTVWYCRLLGQWLIYCHQHHLLAAIDWGRHELVTIFKKLVSKCLQGVVKGLDNSKPEPVITMLDSVRALFSLASLGTDESPVMDICCAATPRKLLDKLREQIHIKPKKTLSATRPSTSRQAVIMDLDDFDIDSDLGNGGDDDHFEDLDVFDSQDGADNSDRQAWQSLFCFQSLSAIHQLRVKCAEFLCAWCLRNGTASCQGEITEVDRLVDMCAKLDLEVAKPVNLQVVSTVVKTLCACQGLSAETLENVLNCIKVLLRTIRRDQEVFTVTIHLLANCIKHLKDPNADGSYDHCRQTAIKLLRGLWRIHMESSDALTCPARQELVKCCMEFMLIDPVGDWAQFQTDNDEVKAAADIIVDLLTDDHHEVRLCAASLIDRLFSTRVGPLCRNIQNERFDAVYTVLAECMDISSFKLDPDKTIDERSNRTASMLTALQMICSHSSVCEKKALYAFCLSLVQNNIELEVLTKVLKHVTSVLGFPSLTAFVDHHLPFLIHQWLLDNNTIESFPYGLLDCETDQEFFKGHYLIIVPFLVMSNDLTSVGRLATCMDRSVGSLLTECIPKIMVHILPLFAANKSGTGDSVLKGRAGKANHYFAAVEKEVSKKVVEQSIFSHLSELTVDILMTMDDPTEDDLRNVSPEPNPPVFTKSAIIATLNYLTEGHSTKASSLVSLLAKTTQDGIQRILLSLRTKLLASTQRVHDLHRCLGMYAIFVRLLLRELHGGLGGGAAFVLRDIVYTLVHVTNRLRTKGFPSHQQSILLAHCCQLWCEVCTAGLECMPEHLAKFLSVITEAIVPYMCSGHTPLVDVAKRPFDLLIVQNADTLKSALVYLDPFPENSLFDRARVIYDKLKYRGQRWSLKKELDHFLAAKSYKTTTSVEGVRYLCKLFEERRAELADLLRECQELQCTSTLLCLVLELVRLSHSGDESLSLEVARCLGIIGPVELSVNAVSQEPMSPGLSHALKQYSKDGEMLRNCVLFHALNHCLTDESVQVVTAASRVLSSMLSTASGQSFSSDYQRRLPDDPMFTYFHPFMSKKRVSINGVDSSAFLDNVGDSLLWSPDSKEHSDWLTSLTCTLIDSGGVTDELLRVLRPMCEVKASFCETILPYVIHDILKSSVKPHHQLISHQVTNFFAKHCGLLRISSSRTATPLPVKDPSFVMNKKSVAVMLKVIQYLRQQKRARLGTHVLTPWDDNFWLEVNYLQIAKAAQSCGQFFSTILFAEIWWDRHREEESSADSEQSGSRESSQSFHSILSADLLDGQSIQSLLLEAYRSIGDPDAVYGCGAGKLADPQIRIQTYEHENDWSKALSVYDLEMMSATPTVNMQTGILKAIQNFGTRHVLDTYMLGLTYQGMDATAEVEEHKYEAAWRMGKWDLDTVAGDDSGCGYHKSLYSAICAVLDKEPHNLTTSLEHGRRVVLASLSEHSVQSAQTLYPVLTHLACLATVESVGNCVVNSELDVLSAVKEWSTGDQHGDFTFQEPLKNLRCVLLKCLLDEGARDAPVLLDNFQCDSLRDHLVQNLEGLAKTAREASRLQIAEQAIGLLKSRSDVHGQHVSWRLEECRLFWARQERDIAIQLLKGLLKRLEELRIDSREAAILYPHALGLYGSWVAETKSENPSIIMDDYLDKAVNMLEGLRDKSTLDAYLSLARFADSQYQQLATYTTSSTYEAKKHLVEKAKMEASRLKALGDRSSRYLRTLEGQSGIDDNELRRMARDQQKFLEKAIQNYFHCLQKGDAHDLRVFRLTSLWFDNAKCMDDINELVDQEVKNVPSHKFLPLMYQLAARLSMTSSGMSEAFQPTLQKIIERCAREHPYHTLPIILALANANKDDVILKQPVGGRKKLSAHSDSSGGQEEDRVQVSRVMIEKLKGTNPKRASLITNMEAVCDAYIQLANFKVDEYKDEKKPIALPRQLLITQISKLSDIPVFTVNTKVDPSCQYKDVVHIRGFGKTFQLVGGINLPKIITCQGSDGVERKQLVKGKDDLRQDAVMEQVFGLVNDLLAGVTETHRRRLSVRTYKVIPLSQRSGLLEWCEGTTPIGQYLVGSGREKGAHERYRPLDWTAMQCRRELMKARKDDGRETLSTRLMDAYKRICDSFKPVFRHFFLENFLDPSVWYERRLAYTRSVATNSIVGYILGLGDRHVQNILIDCRTAELIHIDLGIAFEQGKLLPTPETIPFRLTRDIVDGMGATGVEGVFRRCCEKTMEVMRHSQEALMTILQVLLYDPLYAWTLSPQRAFQLQQQQLLDEQDGNQTSDIVQVNQQDNSEQVNKMAERALLRLKQKLNGLEDGNHLSVSGQVNHLIRQARDVKNLSQLFAGWQPYL